MGVAPFRNLRANTRFTMATGAESERSRSEKSLPAMSGIPNVLNHRAETWLPQLFAMPPRSVGGTDTPPDTSSLRIIPPP